MRFPKGATVADRFFARVKMEGPRIIDTPCWEWTGAKRGGGYGTMGFYIAETKKKPHKYAHRIAWELYKGSIPEGMSLCHRCDNPGCVNPEHLFLGTHKDNMNDRDAKGRNGKGWRYMPRKEVRRRILSGESDHSIAKQVGCHRTAVGKYRRQMLAELEEVWPEKKQQATAPPDDTAQEQPAPKNDLKKIVTERGYPFGCSEDEA